MRRREWASRQIGAWVWLVSWASGCAFEFDETEQRDHAEVGAEMFRVVCLNLAAQAFPNDLTGEQFTSRCEGADGTPFAARVPKLPVEQRALARFNALVARRSVLVPALDAVFASDVFEDDELRGFLAQLIPLYDPPELLPQVTRETANLLSALIREDDAVSKAAVAAFERMGNRDGYRPLRLALGVARPALAYPGLDQLVTTTLESVAPETGEARGQWLDLLRAAAADLATADATPPDPAAPGSLAIARRLLLAEDDAFSAGRGPLLLTARDHRGLARPARLGGVLPSPFVDMDGDTFADVDAVGRFIASQGPVPSPFRTLSAAILGNDTPRDLRGRALNMLAAAEDVCAGAAPAAGCGATCDASTPCNEGLACDSAGTCVWNGSPPVLFEYLDADRTLLAGLTRDLGPLMLPRADRQLTAAALHDFAYGLNAVLGDQKTRTFDYDGVPLAFQGPDTSTGPIFDLVHALGNVLPFEETDQLLQVVEVLFRDHESELAGLIEAVLYIDARADQHPEAHWETPHEFWDDLVAWLQRVDKRDGMLEALLRGMATEANAKAGPLIGNFMRFKDRVTYPEGKREELEALGIDMTQAVGRTDDDAISEAVAAHRAQVNAPCPNPPTAFLGATDSAPGCVPQAPHPASNHRGIRGCPDDKPTEGASCADAGGVGLCSWDAGSCTCDCAGGLCRGDMTPTWQCSDTPTPGFARWVDRAQPDLRVAADGFSNQSLFQRTLALVHDLHVPAKLCNKSGARMKLYDPAGSNEEPLGGALGALLGAVVNLGPYAECELLNETQIVQFFAQSILGTAELKLQNEQLDQALDNLLPLLGTDKSHLMERQTQIRGLFVDHPTPQAVARMVFSPFDAFENGLLNLPVTRDGTPVVDLHRDTIFAWELKDAVSQASYYEALKPLLTAFDTHELRDDDGNLLDGYLFGELITLVHRHWSSRSTDATVRSCEEQASASCENPPCCDLGADLFAYQSNGVSYEELAAEALVDAQLLARLRDVMLALDAIEVAPGVDGITVLARATSNLIDPVKSCVGGDCAAHPLAYRDGRTTTTTNTGKPITQVPAVYLLFDALNAMDKRFEGDNEKRLAPWREARSQIVDLLFEVERDGPGRWHFQNPRTRPVLTQVSRFVRDRLATYGAEEEACLAAGGSAETCQQRRAWSVGLAARLERSLGQPISAASLNLLERFWGAKSDPGGELLKMAHWLSQEGQSGGADQAIDSTLLAATDMLQLFENTENTAPVMHFLARAIAPNALEAIPKGELSALDLAGGSVEKALTLLREVKKLDPAGPGERSTLTKLLGELVKVTGDDGQTPLEVILDTIAEVNRAAPGGDALGTPLDASDLRAVLRESGDFLSGERHGIERLYDIIQARELP